MFYKNMEIEGIPEEVRSPIHSPRKRLLEDAQKYEDFTRREQEEVKQKRRRINAAEAAEALSMLNSPRASPAVGEEMHHGPPPGFFSDDNSSSDDPMATMDVASENPALE